MAIKTFEDLDPANESLGIQRGHLKFENGYGISVITGYGAYSDEDHPYECAVLKDGDLCCNTHITSDVIGYCDMDDVTRIMKQIQELEV